MDVAIVGGGLGGLATAAYLEQAGPATVVLERAGTGSGGGWGIALWPSGLAVLDELGVGEAVRARGAPVSSVELRGPGGALQRRLRLDTGMVAVHRTELHACLREAVGDETVVDGAEVVDLVLVGAGVVGHPRCHGRGLGPRA